MSRNAEITFEFGDGEHTFRLAIGQWREIQEKIGVAPFVLYRRLREALMVLMPAYWQHLPPDAGGVKIDDCSEVIRIALIGGGMEPLKALNLVQRYVHERPLAEAVPVALRIVSVGLLGPEDEPVGKQGAATEEATTDSPSPPSTEPAQ